MTSRGDASRKDVPAIDVSSIDITSVDAPFFDVCEESALRDDSAAAFQVAGRDLLLCRSGGQVFAIADRCTHAAWSLAGAEIADCEILCALHGARFDLRTGEATAHPATKPVRTFAVRIREGRVEVRATPPPR